MPIRFFATVFFAFLFAAACGQDRPPGLEFIPNHGQWDQPVAYRADMKGGRLFVERQALTYVFLSPADMAALHPGHQTDTLRSIQAHAVRVVFDQALPPRMEEQEPTETTYSFFLGSDPLRWAGGLHGPSEGRGFATAPVKVIHRMTLNRCFM